MSGVLGIVRHLRARWTRSFRARDARTATPSETMQEVFTRIYETRAWGPATSASGPGSDIERTAILRGDLSRMVRRLAVDIVLDVGCGDFHWMSQVQLGSARYIGIDIVPELIATNTRQYATTARAFQLGDITQPGLPRADLILCRDCLVHLPLANVAHALANFARSGAQYLLATTFTACQENSEIALGDWRPLNLQRSPFDLPEPLEELDDRPPGRADADKRLGLWRLA
jgi:SAM-dependent methyltransferase